jgi:hypothetical protein
MKFPFPKIPISRRKQLNLITNILSTMEYLRDSANDNNRKLQKTVGFSVNFLKWPNGIPLILQITASTKGAGSAVLEFEGPPKGEAESAPNEGVLLFLCGDVMTGRGIDQILPHPSEPNLYEICVQNAMDYVRLAEMKKGPLVERQVCQLPMLPFY